MFQLNKIAPFKLSLVLHGLLLVIIGITFLDFTKLFEKKATEQILMNPIQAQVISIIEKPPETTQNKVDSQVKKVFGVSRKSLTSVNSLISVKAGNTVAKENDDLILEKNDLDSLPIPVADYLITDEPVIIYEPKNKQRTEEARKNGYTAIAQLKILIDTDGIVRDVKLMNTLKYGLDIRAIELAQQVRLKPALVNGKAVAVIRDFTIQFKSSD